MFETCCRHVAKTGDIKEFVITEESGIAKGIRRIVAVTGYEAQEMNRLAQDFKFRIDQVSHLSDKEQDAALKALSVVSKGNFCPFDSPSFTTGFRNSAKLTSR